MKRFQQLPTESAKIGRILFWLFPDDQSMFYRRGNWAHRATPPPSADTTGRVNSIAPVRGGNHTPRDLQVLQAR
jgi:hypothetical protein